jgi:hypothetical protein
MADQDKPSGDGDKPKFAVLDFAKSKAAAAPANPAGDWRSPAWVPSVENLVIECEGRFADFRYVRALARWFVFDGGQWGWDECDSMNRRTGAVCREIAAHKKRSVRAKLEDGVVVSRIERRLRGQLPATSEQWDADPWLINTTEGGIKTGEGE